MSTVHDPVHGIIHGYVVAICTTANPNFFTGSGYSACQDDAKVFRTIGGAKCAAAYWQHADHNPHPLPLGWYASRKAIPVVLTQLAPMI